MNKNYPNLKVNNIYPIPVGDMFNHDNDKCWLVYAPLTNKFFLSLIDEVEKLESMVKNGETNDLLAGLMASNDDKPEANDIQSVDTFCTLHLLLNEKCNFHCKYCYSAEGRSSTELNVGEIRPMLEFFLSKERSAIKNRTIMFMGGGEPVLSWDKLVESTMIAKQIAAENGVNALFSLTTNCSILTDEMLEFLKENNFTVQVSFEILPDVQDEQRGMSGAVAANLVRLTEAGVSNYVRSTITALNVDRQVEMVKYCQEYFPKVNKLSFQYVVDPTYFTSKEVVKGFFDRYYKEFNEANKVAKSTGIELRSSASHLINYSKREKFCYNLVCLTPYGTLTTCPDVSSPKERDYKSSVFGEIKDNGVAIDKSAFDRLTSGSIHTIDKCKECWAKWNCGSGCPSSRRVYTPEIFDAICDFYRQILCYSLISELASKYEKSTGREFYSDISKKL